SLRTQGTSKQKPKNTAWKPSARTKVLIRKSQQPSSFSRNNARVVAQAQDDAEEREEGTDDPQAHRHLALAPAQRLEVVVDGGGAEDLLAAAQFLAGQLDDDGQDFQKEHEPD